MNGTTEFFGFAPERIALPAYNPRQTGLHACPMRLACQLLLLFLNHRWFAAVGVLICWNAACQAQDDREQVADAALTVRMPASLLAMETYEELPEPSYQRVHSVRDITLALATTDGDLPRDLSEGLFETSQHDA